MEYVPKCLTYTTRTDDKLRINEQNKREKNDKTKTSQRWLYIERISEWEKQSIWSLYWNELKQRHSFLKFILMCAVCLVVNPKDKLILKLSLGIRPLVFALSCHRSTKWWIVVVAVWWTKRNWVWFVCHVGQFLNSSLSFSCRIQNIIAQLKISYFSDLKVCRQQQWRHVSDNEIVISIFHSLN